MAALPVIANVYRTALIWSDGAGSDAVNVLHFRGAPGSAAGLYTAIEANVTANMWAQTSSTTFIREVAITPLDGSTATLVNNPVTAAKWSGQSTSSGIPQSANIIKLRTAKRGASYRGRIFLPWVTETAQAFGILDSTSVTTQTATWVTFRTAVAAAGYTLVVASYKLATAELVVTATSELYTGTQRRRQSQQRP